MKSTSNQIKIQILTCTMLCLIISGCASTAFEIMKDPRTGDVRECKVDPWGDVRYQHQVDTCVARWEKAGYQKLIVK